MFLRIKVDPSVVDDRQAPPALPLRLEHPSGAVGQPVDKGGQHRAVGGQGADDRMDDRHR
jgi:hypothetical protein